MLCRCECDTALRYEMLGDATRGMFVLESSQGRDVALNHTNTFVVYPCDMTVVVVLTSARAHLHAYTAREAGQSRKQRPQLLPFEDQNLLANAAGRVDG